MYPVFLALHSLLHWLVIISLLFSVFRIYRGWLWHKPFLRFDRNLLWVTLLIIYVQLITGVLLYFSSAIVHYFLSHFKEAVHQQDLRFFGMEHITSMVVAIVLITLGFIKGNRKKNDHLRFKIMAIWWTIALLIILFSIPWPFSPFTHRPNFRSF